MNPNECRIVLATNVGNSRSNQEDNAVFARGRFLSPSDVRAVSDNRQTLCTGEIQPLYPGILVCVSDGMGGHASGEIASGAVAGYLSATYQQMIGAAGLGEGYIVQHIAALNRYVCSLSQNNPDYRGMGATLCGAVSNGGSFYGFSAGDSRLYHYMNGKLTQLSKDHTEGQRLLDLGMLSPKECESFPRRKHLYKYVGTGAELVADVFKIGQCVPGAKLLMCSDGLCDVISESEIESALSSGKDSETVARALVDDAVGRSVGKGDNVTLVLVEF